MAVKDCREISFELCCLYAAFFCFALVFSQEYNLFNIFIFLYIVEMRFVFKQAHSVFFR